LSGLGDSFIFFLASCPSYSYSYSPLSYSHLLYSHLLLFAPPLIRPPLLHRSLDRACAMPRSRRQTRISSMPGIYYWTHEMMRLKLNLCALTMCCTHYVLHFLDTLLDTLRDALLDSQGGGPSPPSEREGRGADEVDGEDWVNLFTGSLDGGRHW
jgi:hypothetical protein